jgi:hypothetical protein
MVVHTCVRCGYSTTRKDTYTRHLNRKRKCKPKPPQLVNPNESKMNPKRQYKCSFCDKTFSTNSNLCKHVRRSCKVKREEQLIEQSNVTNINIHQSIVVNNTLNSFGGEDINHLITPPNVFKWLRGNTQPVEAFAEAAGAIWCDPEHPENHTIQNFNDNHRKHAIVIDADGDKIKKPKKDIVTEAIKVIYNLCKETERPAREDSGDNFNPYEWDRLLTAECDWNMPWNNKVFYDRMKTALINGKITEAMYDFLRDKESGQR